jgi:predicted DNA-binding antitoxin AbrB/MazE fold protein
MEKTIQAVCEDGIVRPLEPILLEERQEVTVTIFDQGNVPTNHPLLASSDKWASAAGDQVSLDEVRQALASIRGSLSEAVIEERRNSGSLPAAVR